MNHPPNMCKPQGPQVMRGGFRYCSHIVNMGLYYMHNKSLLFPVRVDNQLVHKEELGTVDLQSLVLMIPDT